MTRFGIAFIKHAQQRKIRNPNKLNMIGNNKAKKPKHDSHNQPRSPVYT
jgi:hypothetical protein